MQDYGLGLRVGLKDLPTLRTRIHRQILTELKTFLFYHSTFLAGRTDASRARLRDVHFLALCSYSFRKTMSAKATATAAWDWKDPESAKQAPGPQQISAPIHVPPSPLHDPHVLPPKGFKKPWKGKIGKGGKEIELPYRAYEKDAETPTEYWWAHPDGMWLQTFRFGCAFHVIFVQNACFPYPTSILPILCVAEEDEVAFDGAQRWHVNWYDSLGERQRHQLHAQRKEEGEEGRPMEEGEEAQEGRPMEEAEDPWNVAWREPQPDDPHAQWQKEIEIERLADIARTPSPSPSPTPPGTPKHSPEPRTEAERGMHRYAPLHHGTCYMVPFLHRQPLFTATMKQRKKDWEGRRRSPEPRAEGAPKTASERGIPVVASLVCLSFLFSWCIFSWLPLFSPAHCTFVGWFV